MRTYVAASAAIVIFLAASSVQRVNAQKADTSKAVSEKARAELVAMHHDFATALQAGDLAKSASFYASDVSIYAPGMKTIKGHAAVEKMLQGPKSAMAGDKFEMSTSKTQVGAAGDIAYTSGTYRLSHTSGQAENGRYLAVWKKQTNGSWRISEAMFNSAEPATAAR